MTTCPYCDDIWLVKSKNLYCGSVYHVNCKCGYAWDNSSWNYKKGEAKRYWEKYIYLLEQNQLKQPKY